MRTLKIVLAYDGTRYAGWQRQPDATTVQALLEAALSPLDGGRAVRVVGAGRTDAGVHALGQVATCHLRQATIDAAGIQRALNARLPADVRVVAVTEEAEGFHARYGAVAKTYVYRLLNGPVVDPFVAPFVWHVLAPLDVPAMAQALAVVVGEHDFKAFQAAGTRVDTTVRTITRADVDDQPWTGVFAPLDGEPFVVRPPCRLLTFAFRGNGFLRHMVRNLVGTTVEVGFGRRPPENMREVLRSRDRRLAGPTAPPQGLVLEHVEYAPTPPRD